MFGLFKNNKPKLTITEEDKNWVETNLLWLGEVFGFDRIIQQPFVLPILDQFPYTNLKDEEQFEALLCQLCNSIGIDRSEIAILFFKEEKKVWTVGDGKSTAGYYSEVKLNNKKYRVAIDENNLNDFERLVNVLMHELMHVKLLGGKFVSNNEADMEGFNDLAVIYYGFGVFMANSAFRNFNNNLSRVGYLPDDVIAYANALICKIADRDYTEYHQYFNINTKKLFEANYEYLAKTENTKLDKNTVNRTNEIYRLNKSITKAFENKDYDGVLILAKKLEIIDDKKPEIWNSLGYGYLMLGNFDEAIKAFDKAIDIDPFWDYPFDNRAFCKIQRGELESAYTDIIISLEFDNQNSYTWRTLGIYHLLKQEYADAVENLEKAFEMDAQTDLIHFYLAKVYDAVGDKEKSGFHHQKSIDENETTEDFLKANTI